jgi:methyl-accepting chemotaxis protein
MTPPWKEKGDFPRVPPSLNDHAQSAFEMVSRKQNNLDNITSLRSTSAKQITPYLGLRSRLSQVWINRWTVLLLLVLAHFLLTIGSLNDNLAEAKVKALASCTKVEDVGSAFASMPHYLSVGVNQLTASSITHAVQALMTVLDMILTGIEQLILFVIGMMTDTYVCLITMVVHGGLNASAVAVEKTTDAVNKAIDGVADGIAGSAGDIQSVIDKIYDVADKAGNIFDKGKDDAGNAVDQAKKGGEDLLNGIGLRRDLVSRDPVLHELILRDLLPAKPDLQKDIVDKMNELKSINIDTSGFVQGLDNLNDKLPTFDDIKNLTGQAVSLPFNLIRQQIDEAYGNWKFNDSVFPVAEKESLSFCSDNNGLTKFFDSLFKIVYDAKIAAIVILALLAIAACVPMYILEKRRWRRQNESAAQAVDILDYGYIYSSPLTARTGLAISSKFDDKNKARKVMVRWFIAYATSLPALFVLSLALAGFFACFWQVILLKTIEKEVPALSQQVGDFAGDVVKSLTNVSQKWSDDANGVLTSYSTEINDDILGKVTNGTSAVNDTLNTFMEEIDKGINTVFGDTLFKDLATGVVRCLLGLKVEAVQKGLTWVHDHARVDFPMFPNDIFSVGANNSIGSDSHLTSFLASPSSVTSDEITGAVLHVTNWLHNQIIQEALISTGLLLVYILVVLLGMMRAMYVLMTPAKHTFSDAPLPSPRAHRSSSDSSAFESYHGTEDRGPTKPYPPVLPAMRRSSFFHHNMR